MDHVDNYCERVAPGLWGEPANALTNVAFLIASGLLVWLLSRQSRRVPVSIWLLPLTTAVVGLCSLVFHLFATGFTRSLDTLSIGVFILITATVAVHWIWGVPWTWAWLAAPAYVAFTLVFTAVVATLGDGSDVLGGYLSALVALVGFGLALRLTAPAESRRYGALLVWAAALFAVSLTLRTLDGPMCARIPVGTHFLWHCVNAAVMFLVSYAVIRCWRMRSVG